VNIILATCGSRGDVQPMIALCLALKDKGHAVRLIGPPEKASWAQQLKCPYLGFGKDVTAFIDTMKNATSLYAGFSFISFVHKEIQTQFKELPDLVKDADLIMGSSLMFGLSSIAQALNIPYRYIAFTPQLFPSSNHPFLALKTQTLPLWLNRFSWDTAKILDTFILTRQLNQYRKKAGLGPIKDAWDHILGHHPILACDSAIAGIPADVTKHIVQTGFLHLELPCPGHMDLERFIQNGSKPVYAGFGSMPPEDQKKNIPLLIHAAKHLGKRLVIAKFWKDSGPVVNEEDVFFITAYPHLNLFPRMAAVIHHGGAGTTAAAAISGVPQIIVPHILDQYFHGQKIYANHLGPKPIWRKKLTQKNMTDALDECLSNSQIRQTAKDTAKKIDMEKSMRMTIRTIEQTKNLI